MAREPAKPPLRGRETVTFSTAEKRRGPGWHARCNCINRVELHRGQCAVAVTHCDVIKTRNFASDVSIVGYSPE